MASLTRQGRFDHLIIESTGVSEPLPVAETFIHQITGELDDNEEEEGESVVLKPQFEDEVGTSTPTSTQQSNNKMRSMEQLQKDAQCLFDCTEIDSMVTVVDAFNFLHDMEAAEDLSERYAL